MGRKASVRYWTSKGAYCCEIKGKQYTLAVGPDDALHGPTYRAALDKFREILELDSVNFAGDRNTVRAICESYLSFVNDKKSAGTYKVYKTKLVAFCDNFGERQINTVTPHEVEQWIRSKKGKVYDPVRKTFSGWCDGGEQIVIQVLRGCFNWGRKRKLCTVNPTDGLEMPGSNSRGEEAYLHPEQVQLLLSAARTDLSEFLTVLSLTGARPSEIAQARGSDYDPGKRALVHKHKGREADSYRHKTAGKTRRNRTIFLVGDALAVVLRRRERYGDGYLFPVVGSKGQRARDARRVSERFRRLADKVGLHGHSTYSLRHTFATNFILSGGDIDTLSALVGSSPNTLRKHYLHLLGRDDIVRAKLEAALAMFAGNGTAVSAGKP